MKNIIRSFVLAFFLSAFTYAQGGHLHGDSSIDENNQAHAMQCGMMEKMSHEQKVAMQKRMKKMKLTMKKIHSEKDVKKREVLMKEQMADMQTCMGMMEKMMGESPMGHEHKGS